MNGQNRWLYLIKRMVYRFFDDGIPQSAAELSYFLLFSMFPLLMFVNSMLAQLDLSIEGMQPVLEMLPKSLQQLIGGYIQRLTGCIPSIDRSSCASMELTNISSGNMENSRKYESSAADCGMPSSKKR